MKFEYTKEDEINFHNSYKKTYDKDGKEWCWLWIENKNAGNYGYFRNSSNSVWAHRFSVQLNGREIPKGFEVNHKCENRQCVNPEHLNIISKRNNLKLRGRKQSLDDPDEVCQSTIIPKPRTEKELCLIRLEDEFFEVRHDKSFSEIKDLDFNNESNIIYGKSFIGGQNVADMLWWIKSNRGEMYNHFIFSFDLPDNEFLYKNLKRKYFRILKEIIEDYKINWKELYWHYVDRKLIIGNA